MCVVLQPGLYHLFKFTEFGSEIIKAGSTSVSVVGSQMFIQLSGIASTSIDVGWLGVYNPSSLKSALDPLFEGIMEELVRTFRLHFNQSNQNVCNSTCYEHFSLADSRILF